MNSTINTRPHTIRCAHCKGLHNTVGEVKECSRQTIQSNNSNAPFYVPPVPVKPVVQVQPSPVSPSVWEKLRAIEAFISDGRYAIENNEGVLKFYHISTGKPGGKWSGRRFIKVLASDTEYPVKSPESRYAIFRKVMEVGEEAASARYGHEKGQCGVCGRSLTDAESRARGIGPICADKMGWM